MLSPTEQTEAVFALINTDGWQKVLIPAMQKHEATLLNKICNEQPYSAKTFELGQLSAIRFFLQVASNNKRLAEALRAETLEAPPFVAMVQGSPYDPPRPVVQ